MNIWTCDLEMRVTHVLYDELTTDPDSFVGGTDYDWLPQAEADLMVSMKRQALETRTAVQRTVALPWGGETRDFDIVFAPNLDAQGRPQGLICYCADITERLRWLRLRPPSLPADEPSPTLQPAPSSLRRQLVVDSDAHGLKGPGGEIRLTRIEWLLLTHMLANSGRVLQHEDLLEHVWGPSYRMDHRLLHDTVSRLRHRFQAAGLSFDPIETVHGVGYRLVEAPQS